jgi:transcription-repair coupling factor (superfamily II helicase)
VLARAAGLTDVAAQGSMVRFAPADLPESRQMRLARLYPGAQVKAVPGTDTAQVLIPKPKTARIGGKDLVDAAVLEWARGVVESIFAKEPAAA